MKSNIISVPPRRRRITYKGLHGWIEFKLRGGWSYTLKLLYPITKHGTTITEEEAVLELKKQIDLVHAGRTKDVRSID